VRVGGSPAVIKGGVEAMSAKMSFWNAVVWHRLGIGVTPPSWRLRCRLEASVTCSSPIQRLVVGGALVTSSQGHEPRRLRRAPVLCMGSRSLLPLKVPSLSGCAACCAEWLRLSEGDAR
jgi:hypothetical protein